MPWTSCSSWAGPGTAWACSNVPGAQGLLALLAERDIVFSADVPDELESERQTARADYQRLIDRLAKLDSADKAGRQAVHDEMQAVRLRQDEVAARIRNASPRLADLQYPEPLDLDGMQGILEPGTVAIHWSLGEERGVVAAVTADDFRVEFTNLTLRGADRLVQAMRGRCSALGGSASESPVAEALYDALLAPVSGLIDEADRLVLMPDGPLWLLPFGTLPLPGENGVLAESQAHESGRPRPRSSASSNETAGSLADSASRHSAIRCTPTRGSKQM